jgi:hypothetical protein
MKDGSDIRAIASIAVGRMRRSGNQATRFVEPDPGTGHTRSPRKFANPHRRLPLIARDEDRGRRAVARLAATQYGPHRLISVDLPLMSGVPGISGVVAQLEATEQAIDVPANNAGTGFHHRALTAEGIEAHSAA